VEVEGGSWTVIIVLGEVW